MSKKLKIDNIAQGLSSELSGSAHFKPTKKVKKQSPTPPQKPPKTTTPAPVKGDTPLNRGVSKQVSKFTGKLDKPGDPAINKVGFYFTGKENEVLEKLVAEIKPKLKKRTNTRITKNLIVRACLRLGIENWQANKLTSKLVKLLVN